MNLKLLLLPLLAFTMIGCVQTIHESEIKCDEKGNAKYELPDGINGARYQAVGRADSRYTMQSIPVKCNFATAQVFELKADEDVFPPGYVRPLKKGDYLSYNVEENSSKMVVKRPRFNKSQSSTTNLVVATALFILMMGSLVYNSVKGKSKKPTIAQWLVSPFLIGIMSLVFSNIFVLLISLMVNR